MASPTVRDQMGDLRVDPAGYMPAVKRRNESIGHCVHGWSEGGWWEKMGRVIVDACADVIRTFGGVRGGAREKAVFPCEFGTFGPFFGSRRGGALF